MVKLNPHALKVKRGGIKIAEKKNEREKLSKLPNFKPNAKELKANKLKETNTAIRKQFFEKIFDFQGVGEKNNN